MKTTAERNRLRRPAFEVSRNRNVIGCCGHKSGSRVKVEL